MMHNKKLVCGRMHEVNAHALEPDRQRDTGQLQHHMGKQ